MSTILCWILRLERGPNHQRRNDALSSAWRGLRYEARKTQRVAVRNSQPDQLKPAPGSRLGGLLLAGKSTA